MALHAENQLPIHDMAVLGLIILQPSSKGYIRFHGSLDEKLAAIAIANTRYRYQNLKLVLVVLVLVIPFLTG